jgi:hypothetical protein
LAAAYAFVDTLVIPDESDALLPSEWLSYGEACGTEEMSRVQALQKPIEAGRLLAS